MDQLLLLFLLLLFLSLLVIYCRFFLFGLFFCYAFKVYSMNCEIPDLKIAGNDNDINRRVRKTTGKRIIGSTQEWRHSNFDLFSPLLLCFREYCQLNQTDNVERAGQTVLQNALLPILLNSSLSPHVVWRAVTIYVPLPPSWCVTSFFKWSHSVVIGISHLLERAPERSFKSQPSRGALLTLNYSL